MIDVLSILVEAHEGHDIHNEFYMQSDKEESLVVIFPGGNYNCDRPLLHYARKAALIAGHDVLCISYGRKEPVKGIVDSLEIETKESFSAIKKCMTKNYKNIYFISKSLGTAIAGRISKELGYDKVKNIFMSPIGKALVHINNSKCLVIVGTEDRMLPEESIEMVGKYENVELVLVDGAKHSLELDNDLEGCLKILSQVTHLCARFIKGD